MPFSLCNAHATFQRLMDAVLAGLQWTMCLVYIDDVVIMGKNFPDHLNNLQRMFQHLQESGLKLQPAKCTLFKQTGTFCATSSFQKTLLLIPTRQVRLHPGLSLSAGVMYSSSLAWQITTGSSSPDFPILQSLSTD